MSVVYFCMYFMSLGLVGTVIALALRRSAFGILMASTLIWFMLGACIYPLTDLLGLVERGTEVSDFIARNGEPGIGAALHILLASAGMFFGYVFQSRSGISKRAIHWMSSKFFRTNEDMVWRYSILLGICSYVVYFYFVGIDVALINAAAARSGEFDGFGEKQIYMFLKTVAAIGFVAASLLPVMLLEKRRISVLAYCLLLVAAYTNSVSRTLILVNAIVPILVYARLKWDMQRRSNRSSSYVIIFALVPFALMVMVYGKVMGQFISFYLTGRDYSMTAAVGDESLIDKVLNGFGYIWVSVQAGIDHFFQTEYPLILQEPFLATFFGFIPSRLLSYFGVEFLYYGSLETTLACVNSSVFGYSECTVPPVTFGYSAYLLPGAGGFVMGFVLLRIYRAIETLWISILRVNYRKIWIPYFLFSTVTTLFTFIPSALALVVPQLLWVVLLSRLRRKPVLFARHASLR